MRLPTLLLLLAAAAPAQDTVAVQVDTGSTIAPFQPVWTYFSYDEPNYTYMPSGEKLVSELAGLGASPVYIRTHNLLNTGDGTPAPKWGSTNVYTKVPAGYPIYDWTVGDRIVDAWRHANLLPLAEIGFMPEALSSHPEPYRTSGLAYPPRDYKEWGELVYRWVLHKVERYGPDDLRPWFWTVWNEPDTANWHGTPEEYYKLYDFAAASARRAFAGARIGGPFSSGPSNQKAAAFLRGFLDHCLHGKNFATGQTGTPLDYVGFDRKNLADVRQGFETISSFAELRDKPVIIGESEAGGHQPARVAAELGAILDLAQARGIRLSGVTQHIDAGTDKPLPNLSRMLAKMSGKRLKAECRYPGVGVLASGSGRQATVLLWHGRDGSASDAAIELTLAGLPEAASRIEVHHYRLDSTHSTAAKLELLEYPQRIPKTGTSATLKFALPQQAVSLVDVTW